MSFEDTASLQNLTAAFAAESQAIQRYLWFAELADVDGHPKLAAAYRAIAETKTGHAHGLLEFLAEVGDPLTGGPIGDAADNFAAAREGEPGSESYRRFAETAVAEGRDEVAEWFETLARANERANAKLHEAQT